MRQLVLSLFLFAAVLVPTIGNAQVYLLPAEPPQVTAASAPWKINGEPVFYAGDFYYAAGPTVFFDGNVMVRSGSYRGVPLYADSTLQPYSVIFVPIGGKVMRPYERKRAGELAGTVGSRMPSFPPQRDVEVSVASGTTGIQTPPLRATEPEVMPEAARPVHDGNFCHHQTVHGEQDRHEAMHAVVGRQHRETAARDRAQAARGVVERVAQHAPTDAVRNA